MDSRVRKLRRKLERFQVEFMNADESIQIETMKAALVNFADAAAEFHRVTEKATRIKQMYFDYAYGVTPALFVVYQTQEDEFLERIRLVREK